LVKKGTIWNEYNEKINCHIAGEPKEKKKLFKILGINGGIDEVEGLDSVDGAKPSAILFRKSRNKNTISDR